MSVTTIYYLSSPQPPIIDPIVTMELDVINIFALPIEVLEGHCKMKGTSLADSRVFFLGFSPVRLSSQQPTGPSVILPFQ